MFTPKARRALLVVLALFVLVQTYLMLVAPNGGWLAQHGLLGAIPAYVVLSTKDPILLTGLIDFMVMATIVEVWMYSELPREMRFQPRTLVWSIAFGAYPCLGVLLYFLWLHPSSRQKPAIRTGVAGPPGAAGAPGDGSQS